MKKKGFTVIELLIVISTLSVLAAILLPKLNNAIEKRKALRLYDTAVKIEAALSEFYKDCGTYPNNNAIGLLWNKNWATAGNVMSGVDPSNCWQGPYIDPLPPNQLSYFYSPFGTASRCTVVTNGADVNGTGNTTDIYVQCSNIPQSVAEILEKKIDGSYQADYGRGDFLATCTNRNCTIEIVIDEF